MSWLASIAMEREGTARYEYIPNIDNVKRNALRLRQASSPTGFFNQNAVLSGMVLLNISLCHSADSS